MGAKEEKKGRTPYHLHTYSAREMLIFILADVNYFGIVTFLVLAESATNARIAVLIWALGSVCLPFFAAQAPNLMMACSCASLFTFMLAENHEVRLALSLAAALRVLKLGSVIRDKSMST